MNNFTLVFERVVILFLLMGVGVWCRRTKLLSDIAVKGIVDLLVIVVTPAIIVDVFARDFDPSMLKGLGIAAILSLAIHLASILFAKLTIHERNRDTEPVLKLAIVFSNSSFMGIPMERAILGDIGVFYGTVYIVIFNLLIWSYGFSKMRRGVGSRIRMIRSALLNPGTVGIALGLVVFLMPWKLPEVIKLPVGNLADINTPLAMIIIGYYLGGAKLAIALKRFKTIFTMFSRLVIVPLAFVVAVYPLKDFVDPMVLLALTIAVSAPTAAMVSMFAAKFNRDVDTSVALVSASTALSIITMPAIIALALTLFN